MAEVRHIFFSFLSSDVHQFQLSTSCTIDGRALADASGLEVGRGGSDEAGARIRSQRIRRRHGLQLLIAHTNKDVRPIQTKLSQRNILLDNSDLQQAI